MRLIVMQFQDQLLEVDLLDVQSDNFITIHKVFHLNLAKTEQVMKWFPIVERMQWVHSVIVLVPHS